MAADEASGMRLSWTLKIAILTLCQLTGSRGRACDVSLAVFTLRDWHLPVPEKYLARLYKVCLHLLPNKGPSTIELAIIYMQNELLYKVENDIRWMHADIKDSKLRLLSWKLVSSTSWVSENVITLQAWPETDLL
jgi:hypothetical protein